LTAALLLGALQGVFEWLPVSSEGVVSASYSFFFDKSFDEAVQFALWLHIGTVPSVLVVFRRDCVGILKEVKNLRGCPSPFLTFLIVATIVSAPIGLGLLIGLEELSQRAGASAMAVVGVLMLVTGYTQLRSKDSGERGRADLSIPDAVIAGVGQGLAVLPGLSRSGTTIAALLARRIDRREALALSFLMSIPASLGAALWAGLRESFAWSGEALVSAAIAFVVGLVVIRLFMEVADRVNLGAFVIFVGLIILAGGIWQAV
jgi:undecaprenyl-diphosphatase